VESERFQVVDTDWRIIMKNANENPEVSALIKAQLSHIPWSCITQESLLLQWSGHDQCCINSTTLPRSVC